MPVTFSMPAVVTLNGVTLTDESRGGVMVTLDPRVIDKQLASGKRIKYLLKNCRIFSITWENVAGDATTTVDGFGGADEIRDLAFTAEVMTLGLTYTNGNTDEYQVFVTGHSEQILMRRNYMLRYTVTLDLEEQG
jgi:hypothetical protein